MKENFISLFQINNKSSYGDFNGPFSILTNQEQVSYLKRYFNVAKKEYGFDENNHVVDKKEVEEFLSKIPFETFSFRNRRYINSGFITSFNNQKYKYISLFNDAKLINSKIVLPECEHNPLPAFELECPDFKYISFIINMDSKYRFPLRGMVDTMVPCRNIEFKNGLEEMFKLGIYSNGEIYARIDDGDKYHHKNIKIGDLTFDKDNQITLAISQTSIVISISGKETTFINKTTLLPNMMFVGSGLHMRFRWEISINDITLVNGEKLNVSELNDDNQITSSKLINLPYAFGTFANRHKSFAFESEFKVNDINKLTLLNIEEIGPRGEVFINDKFIKCIDDLSFNSIDISSLVNIGNNKLKIIVHPTAPENIISWHRQKDPYFGSYLGNVYVEEVNQDYIKNAKIITNRINKNNISIRCIYNSTSNNPKYKTSIYDLNNNLIYESFDSDFSFIATAWCFNNPKLYRIITQLIVEEVVKDEYEIITGFRTVNQVDGTLVINGKQEILKGALIMQYLPPYNEIQLNHVMPSISQIIEQVLQAKKMNSNCLRMHHLGYGMNDYRFSRVCDYLGISSIWTTRYIDTAFGIIFDGKWHQKHLYQKQMQRVINSPSIIMWEGANEYYLYREDIDNIYREFVGGVKEIDATRLISPVSHLYYGNDAYDKKCQYYQDNGLEDEFFNKVTSAKEWNDDLVVRSAHTYNLLLGYGTTWDKLRNQSWSGQPNLLNSNKHIYLVSEYSIIGRQYPNIIEGKGYFNNNSYEYMDEQINGYMFEDNSWYLSQSYQSLAASFATRKMMSLGADGLLWCSLNGGANDGSYLKPIIDFYGYPKLAFYSLKNCFNDVVAYQDDTDVVWNNNHKLKPIIISNLDNKLHNVKYLIKDDEQNVVFEKEYKNIIFDKKIIRLEENELPILKEGYYKLYSEIINLEE